MSLCNGCDEEIRETRTHPDLGELCEVCYKLNEPEARICEICKREIEGTEEAYRHGPHDTLCEKCFEWVVEKDRDAAQARGTTALFDTLVEIARKPPLPPPHYGTLLVCHLTHAAAIDPLVIHATAYGTRAVVRFSPKEAGALHETHNDPQRYEILINPLKEEHGA